MNKEDREIYEAYDVQQENLAKLGKGALGMVRTGADKVGKAIKPVAQKVGKVVNRGVDKIHTVAQSDRYKNTAFGQTMNAVKSAQQGNWKDAASGLGNAASEYQAYNKNKAAKAAAAKRAEVRGEDPSQPAPAQPATPSASKSTTVQSPSQKQATAKKKTPPKSTSVAHTVKPSVPKNEGTKGTKSDRERADVDGDGEIEDWEKAKANAIRKSQGKKHLCAKVVNHESFGPGSCIHAEHAIPDVDGNIEWYMVEFKHGTEKIQTADVDVVMAVEHVHD